MSETVNVNGRQYEVSEAHFEHGAPDFVESGGYHFLVGSESNEGDQLVSFYHETSSVADTLMNVIEITLDGEQVTAGELGHQEVSVREIVQIHEPSTGIIAYQLHLVQEYVEEPTVTNLSPDY